MPVAEVGYKLMIRIDSEHTPEQVKQWLVNKWPALRTQIERQIPTGVTILGYHVDVRVVGATETILDS